MGKSFVIKAFLYEVIKNIPAENIIIMVPTRALINQFVLDIKKELAGSINEHNYKIATNSTISEIDAEAEHNYILVLTPERIISYVSDDNNPPIGFLFVDEAHKLASHKDSRSITSYTSIEKLVKRFPNINLYFSSPNVSNPGAFLQLFNRPVKEFHTDESPVNQNLFYVDFIDNNLTNYIENTPHALGIPFSNIGTNANQLIDQIGSSQNNLIYCNSRTKTIQKALEFKIYLEQKQKRPPEVPRAIKKAIFQIKTHVHKDYYLVDLLRYGIAFHFGRMPQIVRNIIEDLFRAEHIQYIFCTSTLLEGVNLPAKNVFILSNKKALAKFEDIDFWNLAGRAGRLGMELSGNIFCVREEASEWKDSSMLVKKDIKVEPTIESNIDKKIVEIEHLLKQEPIKAREYEKEILQYIANIISIDTFELPTNYQSPIISKLIENNKSTLVELSKNRINQLSVPYKVLDSNPFIDIQLQNKIFTTLQAKPAKLPNVDYDNCKISLNYFYDLYNWDKIERGKFKLLETKNTGKPYLGYLALLVNSWINGTSLNEIINNSLNWYEREGKDIYIDYKKDGPFNRNNPKHVNQIINIIIDDIENKLRYILQKYYNHYYSTLVEIVGEENAGNNWAQYLEYGTRNPIVIALQNYGLSRHTANYITKNHMNCIEVKDNKLTNIDVTKLTTYLNPNSVEYEEVKNVL